MLSSRVLDGAMIGRTSLISSMAAISNVMSITHNAL
jgi:carbonic anhydrase/acetyltransferase-like protein (isoleucine patch superfamily)